MKAANWHWIRRVAGGLAGLALLSGCGTPSFNPWLDPDTAIQDDRLAGIWIGVGEEGYDQLVIVTATEDPGIYDVMYYADDHFDEFGKIYRRPPPFHMFATLHELEGQLFLQFAGTTPYDMDYTALLAPLYVLDRAVLEGEILSLYCMGLDEDDLEASGLMGAEDGEGYILFSPTEDLTAFVQANFDDPGLYGDEPYFVFKRIRSFVKPPEEAAPPKVNGSG